ncbi:hypothetical protein FA13DRAFT_1742974 [Coprinellus micaceus]|uniref:Uncharacterized protein n=1 Tax=Coprinellus micaceus TaxID=71717 RepID=A0A4Y7SFH1_COPMI|nr:hypothetical protein FA13DRAFT_1742974 [Coprinellus micaceus]
MKAVPSCQAHKRKIFQQTGCIPVVSSRYSVSTPQKVTSGTRAKGGAFGKGLALTQTAWFLVQILARIALGMDVTHLEVTTLAYAALNGVIYWFWWQKPLDVQCPIVINAHPSSHVISSSVVQDTLLGQPAPLEPVYLIPGQQTASTASIPVLRSAPSVPRERMSVWKRASDVWRRVPVRAFRVKKAPVILVHVLQRCINRLRTVVEYRIDNAENWVESESCSTRFPMFYALALGTKSRSSQSTRSILPLKHSATQLMGLVLASAFGAIHCVAWNFQFDHGSPTHLPLGTLWRVSSLCIAASPAPLALLFVIAFLLQWPERQPLLKLRRRIWWECVRWLKVVGEAVVFLYIPARLVLIFLAFYDLARLTPSAHRTVEWASFIPHFG